MKRTILIFALFSVIGGGCVRTKTNVEPSLQTLTGDLSAFAVIVETDYKSKTILSTDTSLPFLPVFYRYSISPFEERALIIIRWNSFSHSYGFIYSGCHLVVGFE